MKRKSPKVRRCDLSHSTEAYKALLLALKTLAQKEIEHDDLSVAEYEAFILVEKALRKLDPAFRPTAHWDYAIALVFPLRDPELCSMEVAQPWEKQLLNDNA